MNLIVLEPALLTAKRCDNNLFEEGNFSHKNDCLAVLKTIGADTFNNGWFGFSFDIDKQGIESFLLIHKC